MAAAEEKAGSVDRPGEGDEICAICFEPISDSRQVLSVAISIESDTEQLVLASITGTTGSLVGEFSFPTEAAVSELKHKVLEVKPDWTSPVFRTDVGCDASTLARLKDYSRLTVHDAAGGAVQLPCSCRIAYCPSCWDRHLAQSMATLGQPKCPTCRSVMRVDFEAETGCLVFSKEESPTKGDFDVYCPNNTTRKRLCDQARPWQIHLLEQYGSAMKAGSAGAVPQCVCKGRLERLDLRARVGKLVDDSGYFTYNGNQYSVDALIQMGAITCDLCGSRVVNGSELWTCENGSRTVLHSHSYDICAECIQKHAFLEAAAPSSLADAAVLDEITE